MFSLLHISTVRTLLPLFIAFFFLGQGYGQRITSHAITPIDTSRFTKGQPTDLISERWRQLLLFTCQEVLTGWWHSSEAVGREHQYVDFGYLENNSKIGHHGPETKGGMRPAAQSAYVIAVSLFTDVYDANFIDVPEQVAMDRSITLIKSLAKDHVSNGGILHAWGNQWQSAQWASKVAVAAWLLWNELEEVDQMHVRNMMEYEANRFLRKHPPAADENYRINTHAEENAWDATGIQTACAMMPGHENYKAWFDKLVEYRLTALATPDDLTNRRWMYDREVRQVVAGYNIDLIGALGNHSAYPHPDYMASPLRHATEGSLFFKLAGLVVPECNRFNYGLVYNNFISHIWNDVSPIYKADGSIYWPINIEEDRRFEYITFSIIDLGAQKLSAHKADREAGVIWEEKHTARALAMRKTGFIAASAYLDRWIDFQLE
ncbi:MAG: hypothetical protein HKN87_09315 [Saprospiraceae bacterium]|nr:hypothetical protein [Saprospiraceae bacterium]